MAPIKRCMRGARGAVHSRPSMSRVALASLLAPLALLAAACPAPGGSATTTTPMLAPPSSARMSPPPPALPVPRLMEIEAGVDLDGQLVGPLGRGQTATVAMVFASWCGHCRHEMPILA